MTTALTLFDIAALNPDEPRVCGWCGNRPATTRVFAIQNLLGVHPAWLTETWYRDAFHQARSGPCCDACAWYVASSWWAGWRACPTGSCCLWAHTLSEPRPAVDCTRHHTELTVVWCTRLELAA